MAIGLLLKAKQLEGMAQKPIKIINNSLYSLFYIYRSIFILFNEI